MPRLILVSGAASVIRLLFDALAEYIEGGYMLILTRRIGETLKIGDNTSITVIHINGNQVRFGIDAPRDLQVLRAEFLDQKPSPPKKHS